MARDLRGRYAKVETQLSVMRLESESIGREIDAARADVLSAAEGPKEDVAISSSSFPSNLAY